MAAVDMELKKAFQELQAKMITTQQQMKVSDLQIEQLHRQMMHSKLVCKELGELPDTIKTYQGVGRMFLLKPRDVVKSDLENKIKECEDKIQKIEATKTHLERSMKESEDNLRELITSKQKDKS